MRREPTQATAWNMAARLAQRTTATGLVLVEAPHFFDTWIGARRRLVAG